MNRMTKLLMLLIVVIMLFHFAGFFADQDSGSYLLDNLGVTNPENIGSTAFFASIALIGTLGATGAIVIGSLGRVSAESAAMLTLGTAFAAVFIFIGWDLIRIYSILSQTNQHIAALIISPLFVAYTITIYDWYMGRD